MASKKAFIIPLVLAAIAGGAWFAYNQALPVATTALITRGTAPHAVAANILVTEEFRMEIKSESGGRIAKSHVKLGADVKTGELLFELDTKDLDLEIKRLESDLKATKARLELGSPLRFAIATAEETVRNNTRLVEQGKMAKVDLDRSKRAVDELKDKLENEKITNNSAVETLEIQLSQKQLAREKAAVIAPEDGTVSEIYARTGDLVGGGQILARVISKARLVQAQISEENFAGVKPGLKANVQLLGYGGKTLKATVARVLPSQDERTKRYTAFLDVEVDPAVLAPGLTGDAVITIDRHENVLLVERRRMVGNAVYLVKDGTVRFTPLGIGYVGLNFTEATTGVNEGDEVIVDSPASFRDGERVRTEREKLRR